MNEDSKIIAEQHHSKGMELWNELEFKQALEFFEKCLEIVPDYKDAFSMMHSCKEHIWLSENISDLDSG